MHELPVINSILKVVLKHAVDNNVNKVIAVHLQVGELSDLEDKWMQQYFDHLAKGGIAEGARLKIERTPVVMKCSDCGDAYIADIKQDKALVCPECGSKKNSLISGREYFVKNLEAI
ncbi:MAG: hydrogenase maturation nickel metallochaperone HypA [Desulfobacteraceae bacterium]|nr:hydrogenase maturation nickel metallochaperone HypA [Desulfobacteraceae bacterium]MBC2756646.1 hydrogenase maturation nickel metallochaperone HypA [Desulfobacteraceae bacterium]